VRWVRRGGDFEVETITRAARGTSVILHLRDDAQDYASAWKLKDIINKYSDHISLPILMEKEEWKEGELINPSDENGGRQPGGMVKTGEWETVNKASALWTRPRKTSRDEQYDEFYKQISHDFEARWPTPTTAWKAAPSTRSCCTSPARPPWTCGTATRRAASSSTSSASSSWTTPRRCCPPTCASSRAWSTRPTCRST
jgi:HSP90 family molecular chaperone